MKPLCVRVVSWEMGNARMLRLALSISSTLTLALALAACSSSPSSPTVNPTPTIDTFGGTWRSTTTTAVGGACTALNWTVTPTTANAATIAYTASCAGIPVSGTANATLSGSTLTWNTTGTAANACGFGLNGSATEDPTSGTLRVDYSGTVCGAPVAGTQILQH